MSVPAFLYFNCYLHDALLATIHSSFMPDVRMFYSDYRICLHEVFASGNKPADQKLLMVRVDTVKLEACKVTMQAMPGYSDRHACFSEIPAKCVSMFQHIDHDDVTDDDAWKPILRN